MLNELEAAPIENRYFCVSKYFATKVESIYSRSAAFCLVQVTGDGLEASGLFAGRKLLLSPTEWEPFVVRPGGLLLTYYAMFAPASGLADKPTGFAVSRGRRLAKEMSDAGFRVTMCSRRDFAKDIWPSRFHSGRVT